jgi:hypothetical protein
MGALGDFDDFRRHARSSALKLRSFEPKARTPVGPMLVAMGLIVIGACLAMFA